MGDNLARSRSGGSWEVVLGIVVTAILAYALLTTNILLGILAAGIIVLGYHIVRWLAEFMHLFRRLVIALERIAEKS